MESEIDDDHLVLDVSGTTFHIHKDVVHLFPNALIGLVWNYHKTKEGQLPKGVYQSRTPNRFFVQRSPIVFNVILQCYTTGKLHVPKWMCKANVLEEIKFWKLETHFACVCCIDQDDDAMDEKENHVVKVQTVDRRRCGWCVKWERIKSKMWTFFQNPKSSRGATVFAAISILFIMISTTCYVVETIPELKKCTTDADSANESNFVVVGGLFVDHINDSILNANITDDDNNVTTILKQQLKSQFIIYFTNCLSMQIFKAIETACVLWFTLELTMRFLVCPNRLKFLVAPLNIIDFMASANIYLEVVLVVLNFHGQDIDDGFTKAVNILRTVTVLRILKFIRYFEDLRLLVKTFKSAKKELSMLCIFVFVTVLIYSCLLYEIEKDNPGSLFDSVPASAWWSIVTLTTVGFGDIVPTTTLGKIVGGLACVTGIIIIALPVSVLVEHFTAAYKKKMRSI